jgi:F-type H+-transporting ATPase subunit gamma
MELISASRIVKAQQRVAASSPYANELTRAVTAVASFSSTNHPLTTPSENPRRAAVLIITADRGMAGAYSNAAIKEGDQLVMALRERGLATEAYLVGRKAVNYYRFRSRKIAGSWTGFSDNPTFVHAKEVSDALISAFLADAETVETGVDELHIVRSYFKHASANV